MEDLEFLAAGIVPDERICGIGAGQTCSEDFFWALETPVPRDIRPGFAGAAVVGAEQFGKVLAVALSHGLTCPRV
ncbi:MAG: hypothetical protein L0G72_10740, partial [Brevibacterium aurantiacum]|nr:hypothetical protein [Brevibacterium aurantiacum]